MRVLLGGNAALILLLGPRVRRPERRRVAAFEAGLENVEMRVPAGPHAEHSGAAGQPPVDEGEQYLVAHLVKLDDPIILRHAAFVDSLPPPARWLAYNPQTRHRRGAG